MFIYKITIVSCLLSLSFWNIEASLKDFSEANQAITTDLYKELTKANSGKNFVISPISIQVLLALLQSGADGATAKEIQTRLLLGNQSKAIDDTFKVLIPSLLLDNTTKLITQIFVAQEIPVQEQFKKIVVNNYFSNLELTDYDKIAKINETTNWGKLELQYIISGLTKKKADPKFALAAINAIYFRANWPEKLQITKGTFKGKKTVNTTFLSGTGLHNYYEDVKLDARVLELSLKGGNSSLVIALPKKDSLDKLEGQIGKILANTSKFRKQQVSFKIPNIALVTDQHLRKVLGQLGIKEAFNPDTASFKKITEKENIYIGNLVHGTIVNFTQDGVRAISLTGESILPRSGFTSFTADRPFLFYIKSNDIILFVGRIVNLRN